MQDVDRIADVEVPAVPIGDRCTRVDGDAVAGVRLPQRLDRIRGKHGRRRHIRDDAAIRPPKLESAIRPTTHLVALLVDRAVVTTTEQREIRQGSGAALAQWTM